MLPAGYLLKHIAPPPGWLRSAQRKITRVCSVADCVNDNIVDVQRAWQHNSFGLANNREILLAAAAEAGLVSTDATLFFYSVYDRELPTDGWTFDPASWQTRTPLSSTVVADAVIPPGSDEAPECVGYDVVTSDDYLEHSPLSCNSVAERLNVNEHCLFATFEEALDAINNGAFGGGCEPGRYTIFAVYRVS